MAVILAPGDDRDHTVAEITLAGNAVDALKVTTL
jgi:hypothetical protein